MELQNLRTLTETIGRLRREAEEAYQLGQDIPAAERNLYMILRYVEMLEVEICDPAQVLLEGEEE